MDYRNQSLGALAIAIPRASRLFRQHQLDFCCGGRQSLAHAAERRRLDIDRLENELAAPPPRRSQAGTGAQRRSVR